VPWTWKHVFLFQESLSINLFSKKKKFKVASVRIGVQMKKVAFFKMSVMLITSCLFGTVVLHAFQRQNALVHFLSLVQTMLSLLRYGMSPPNTNIFLLDMLFALFFFCQGMYQLVKEKNRLVLILWLVGVLYGIELLTENEKYKLFIHALLHIVACLGLHFYLYFD
jgi:hypothetical protein